MANTIEINAAIIKGYNYVLELAVTLIDKINIGAHDCEEGYRIERILLLAETLQHYVDINTLDATTDGLYLQLLNATDDYVGAGGTLDPNLELPNTIVSGGQNSTWGFITGDIYNQLDLINLLSTKADIGDGLITPVSVVVVGSNVVVTALSGANITWKIGTTTVTVPSPRTLPITPASANFFRKDWLLLTLTGLEILQGVENQTIGTLPNIPVNNVGLSPIDVYGAIINASPPAPPVDISAPSWTPYGASFGKYPSGTPVPSNTSAYAQYKEAWTNIPAPNYLAPIASLSATPSSSSLEVGQTLNVNLTLSFNQRNAGAETAREIRKNGVVLGATTDTIVISTTPISYLGNISYAQGAVLNNQAGVPDPNGRINAGNMNSNTINYVGAYFNFVAVGVIATTGAQVRENLVKMLDNVFSLVIPSGVQTATIAYPAIRADLLDSSVKYVEGFNSNVGNTFTKSLFTVNDAGGVPVAYKIYTLQLPAPETNQVTYIVTLP